MAPGPFPSRKLAPVLRSFSTPPRLLPVAASLAVFALLAVFAGVDPPPGVTVSSSPFTDEAWNVLNARNLAVLGQWSTDEWNRHLVSVPFSLLHAFAFLIAGVGIIQARLVEIAAIALIAFTLAAGLRRPLGAGPAVLGAIAFSTSGLVLYYGRLVYLEPLTALGLTLAAVLLLGATGSRPEVSGALAGIAIGCAIGTKLLAVPDAAGLFLGALVVGFRSRTLLRWFLAAGLSLGVVVGLWGLVVWLPHRDAVAAMVTTWPPEPLPRDIGGFLTRIHDYLGHNDGALALSAPLLVGAGVGTILGLLRWRHLSQEARLLMGAALGWALAGFGILAVVPYSPNRYVLPTLPSLAILIAVGGCALVSLLPSLRSSPRLAAAVLLVIGVGLVLPGIARYAQWMSSTPSTLPAIQDRLTAVIPAGSTVEGSYSSLFGMRARAILLITNFGANPGDLYETKNVRWFIGEAGSAPVWAPAHAGAWAARQQVLCVTWKARPACVYRIP